MRKKLITFFSIEFFSIFTPTLFGLTIMVLAMRLVKVFENVQANLSLIDFFLIIMLIIPSIYLIILPISYLIALSITLTKLSNTYELIALNNAGVSRSRILQLFLLITLPILFFNFINSLFIKPACNKVLREMLATNTENIIPLPQKSIFTKIGKGRYLYVEDNKHKLDSIIFTSFEEDNLTIISAREGSLGKGVINFRHGNLLTEKEAKTEILSFENLKFRVSNGTEKKIDTLRAGSITFTDILKLYGQSTEKTLLKTEICYRIFFPLAPLILLFISFPLSIGFSRHYKSRGIMVSIGTGLTFYMLFSLSNTLSLKGKIDPLMGFGLVYILLAFIALFLNLKKGSVSK